MISKIPSQAHTNRWKGVQRRIGLTGGIGTGKSTIGRFLEDAKHIPILDADIYAKEALAPEEESTIKIINRYGKAITNGASKQNIIDRKALAQIIFQNSKERKWIEEIIHPVVKERLELELELTKDEPIVIIIAPLLFEANLTSFCSEVWVVNCTYDQQIQRIIKRDLLTKKESMERVSSQLSMKVKKDLADIVIDNSGKRDVWVKQINDLIRN